LLEVPTEFVAVTEKDVSESVTSGTPLITQVLASMDSPEGSNGVEVQFVILDPLSLNVTGITLMDCPTNPVVPRELLKLNTGVFGRTERVTLPAPVPDEFVAMTVKEVSERVSRGVPLITQVVRSILTPSGKAGAVVQFVMLAPLSSKSVGETIISSPNIPCLPVAFKKLMAGELGETDKVTVLVPLPAELVTVMVKGVELKTPCGEPLITQVEELIVSPLGSSGVEVHEVMSVPPV
jgi:hypothetical protein